MISSLLVTLICWVTLTLSLFTLSFLLLQLLKPEEFLTAYTIKWSRIPLLKLGDEKTPKYHECQKSRNRRKRKHEFKLCHLSFFLLLLLPSSKLVEKQNQEAVASFIASQHAIPTCAKKVGLNLDQLDSPKSERLNLT